MFFTFSCIKIHNIYTYALSINSEVLGTITHQKERRYIFDPISESLKEPDLTVPQQQAVDHVYGAHQAEEGVQDGQVEDEDVRGGGVALLRDDLPDDQDVTGRPHHQVQNLDHEVEHVAVRGH